jgi:hypothetical protein
MGTAAAENVAIHVSTTADLSGIAQSRTALGALGTEADKATAETGKLTVSAEQMRAALAATGGDLQKAAQMVAQESTALNASTVATKEAAMATATLADGTTVMIPVMEEAAVAVRDEAAAANELVLATEQRTAATERSTGAVQKIPGGARTAANGLGILTQAALAGQGSLAGMATAAGGMATGLASITNNAKLAAGAAGIGALITVGVLLYETYKKAKEEVTATVSASFNEHLQNLTFTNMKREMDAAKKRADEATAAAAAAATGDIRDILPGTASSNAQKVQAQAIADYEALQKRVAALRAQERDRAIELAQSSRDEIASNKLELQLATDRVAQKKDDYQLSLEQNDIERREAAQAINEQFRHRDASGQIVALTGEETRLRATLLDQNNKIADAKARQLQIDYQIALQTATATRLQGADTVEDRFKGRLEQIELERQAEIKRLGDVESANENAEQKKRALYRETARQASDDAKTIFDVFRSSSNSTLKAIGTFGENLRRIAIGAEAARALVRAATEGAEAIASLAVGDFRGAALHGASAVQFGAAAALGARESLGGGGTGGGASGGGGGGSSTFTPNQQPASGTTVINLYTQNPYSKENIQQAAYVLQRNGTLNVPIYPTTGLSMAGG